VGSNPDEHTVVNERPRADFQISAYRVRLHLTVKRFRWSIEVCPRAIFTEGFPNLIEKYARRTTRLHRAQEDIAFVAGGEAGNGLAGKLHMFGFQALF
jgi:hypothetical protein